MSQELIGAVGYLERIGMDSVQMHEQALLARLYEGLHALPGVRIYGPPATVARGAVVSFAVEGGDPFLLAQLLDDEGIAVRAGGHCAHPLTRHLNVPGTVRVSPYLYNTLEEVDRFLEVVAQVIRRGIV